MTETSGKSGEGNIAPNQVNEVASPVRDLTQGSVVSNEGTADVLERIAGSGGTKERIPSGEEVEGLLVDILGGQFEDLSKRSDTEGLYYWDVRRIVADGIIGYGNYIRKGMYPEDHERLESDQTVIIYEEKDFNGLPNRYPDIVAKLVDNEWVRYPVKGYTNEKIDDVWRMVLNT